MNSKKSKTDNKRLFIFLSIITIVALATAIILVVCAILPFVLSSNDEQHDHETQPAIVYDDAQKL